jgi:hypothetical protein
MGIISEKLERLRNENRGWMSNQTTHRVYYEFLCFIIAIIVVSTPALSATSVNFATPAPFYELSGAGPGDIEAGDVDNDGDLDILVSSFGSANSDISVLLNNGSGDLSDNTGFALLNAPHGITLQQMDNDGGGALDIIAAVQDYSGGNLDGKGPGSGIDIFYGDGSGGFGLGGGVGNTPNVHISLLEPTDVASADFDGNGVNDLAVSREQGGVAVYLGQIDGGTGELTFSGPTTVGIGSAPNILVDDFDGDNKWDIATPGVVYFGNGAGGFTTGTSVGGSWAVASGDINGDTFKDIAVLSGTTFGTTLQVKLGKADRTFTDFQTYTDTGPNIDFNDVYIADLNRDGYGDVVIADGRSDVVRVFLQGCDEILQAPFLLPTPLADPMPVYVGNMGDADSLPDIVTAMNNGGETPNAAVFMQIVPSAAAGEIQFCQTAYSVLEGAGSVMIKVSRENGETGTVSVDFETVASGAPNAATPNGDYTTTTGSLTFLTGEIEKIISVPVIEDILPEVDEVFLVNLFNPQSGAMLGAPPQTTVTIIDNENNQPPVANASTDQAINEGSNVTLDGSSSNDPDGTIDSFSWTQIAGTMVTLTGSSTAMPTFTAPNVTANTILTFELAVTDNNGAMATDQVNITVQNVNQLPTANAGTDQIVNEGNSVSLDGTASSDTDGAIVGYNWFQTAGPSVTLTGSATANPGFSAPAVLTNTLLTFELTVTDNNGGMATDSVSVTVQNVNLLPTANAGVDQTVNEGAGVTLDGTASTDPDGTIADYSWNQVAGPSVALTGATTSGPTFTAPGVITNTILTFELTVTDNNGGMATDQVNVTVQNVNQLPMANAGVDQTITEGFVVTLNGTASTDADGTIVGYSWNQIVGPSVALTGATTSGSTFTAPAVLTNTLLTFELAVTDNDGGTATDLVNITVTVAPVPGTLSFELSSTSVPENAANVTLSVIRTGGDSGEVTIDFNTMDQSATASLDYQATSGTLTFADGELSKTIQLTLLDDTKFEGDETFAVELTNPQGGVEIGTVNIAQVSITENDPVPPAGVLDIAAATYSVAESDASGFVTITVNRSNGSFGQVSVDYTTTDQTATASLDYEATSGTLIFADSELSKTIQVALLDDTIFEGDETFVVEISNPQVGAGLGMVNAAQVTITENDPVPPAGVFNIAASNYTVAENDSNGLIAITVNRSNGNFGQVSVDFTTTDGSAAAGSDYQATSGSLSFADGELSKTIDIPLRDDTNYEGDETFNLELSNVQGGAALGIVNIAQVTISENDPVPPAGVIQYSGQEYSASEDEVSSLITVTRSSGSFGEVSVDFATSNITAIAGEDYQFTTSTIVFADGETSQVIEVPLMDDLDYEGNETFNVELNNIQGGAVLGSSNTAQVTILENDPVPPAGSLHFSGASYSVAEDNNNIVATVTRAGGSFGQVTADFTTNDGSAVAGSDYTAASGTLTFAEGVISQTITISLMDDSVFEGNESFNIRLSNASGGATLSNPFDTTINILENEPVPAAGSLQFSGSRFSVAEDATNLSITVTRTGGSYGSVTIDYESIDGTAISGTDFVATSGTLTFGDGVTSQTISIPILDDELPESEESFSLRLLNVSPDAVLGNPDTTSITIIDDNDPQSPSTTPTPPQTNSSGSSKSGRGSLSVLFLLFIMILAVYRNWEFSKLS